jgi:hypothetical protein
LRVLRIKVIVKANEINCRRMTGIHHLFASLNDIALKSECRPYRIPRIKALSSGRKTLYIALRPQCGMPQCGRYFVVFLIY